jgi:hypothetical protein
MVISNDLVEPLSIIQLLTKYYIKVMAINYYLFTCCEIRELHYFNYFNRVLTTYLQHLPLNLEKRRHILNDGSNRNNRSIKDGEICFQGQIVVFVVDNYVYCVESCVNSSCHGLNIEWQSLC